MDSHNIQKTDNVSFEGLKEANERGADYWSARDLQPYLGHSQWRRFEDAISGDLPEHIPTAEHIKKVEPRIKSAAQKPTLDHKKDAQGLLGTSNIEA